MKSVLLFLALSVFPVSSHAFYSTSAVEVEASFEHQLELQGAFPSSADALFEVQELMWFMAGPLQEISPEAGPKWDQRIKILGVDAVASSLTRWRVRYSFVGTFVVDQGHPADLKIYLPRNRRTIFKDSQTSGWFGDISNPCMRSGYSTEEYFWYFWSPARFACPLKEGVHYDVITPRVRVLPSTTQPTYPDYPRMVDEQHEIKMIAVFGADQDPKGMISPDGNDDYNAGSYRELRDHLMEAGFSRRTIGMREFSVRCGRDVASTQLVEEFVRQDSRAKLRVTLLWGTTTAGYQSLPYYCLLDEAMSRGAVFMYNAHSGMGNSANLFALRRDFGLSLSMDPKRYQLFDFNGCSSYGYYNGDIFKEKASTDDPAGSRNLDIITNGIAGNFYILGKMSWSVVDAVQTWSKEGRWKNYREIIESMDSQALTAVNGDEDNPRAPRN